MPDPNNEIVRTGHISQTIVVVIIRIIIIREVFVITNDKVTLTIDR